MNASASRIVGSETVFARIEVDTMRASGSDRHVARFAPHVLTDRAAQRYLPVRILVTENDGTRYEHIATRISPP